MGIVALVVIGVWFLLQYLSALVFDDGNGVGVAYWAHIGGFAAGFVILRCFVWYLQRQVGAGEQGEAEPLVTPAGELLGSTPEAAEVPNPMERGVREGSANPFDTFLSVQTVRKMQEKKDQQQPSGS